MSLKRRINKLSEGYAARREAAWKPLYAVAARDLRIEDIHGGRQFNDLPLEERVQAGEELGQWGSETEHATWMEWAEAVSDVCERTCKPWPEDLPEPPEEPEGLWDHFRERAEREEPPVSGAACVALVWLSLARALQRNVY